VAITAPVQVLPGPFLDAYRRSNLSVRGLMRASGVTRGTCDNVIQYAKGTPRPKNTGHVGYDKALKIAAALGEPVGRLFASLTPDI